MKTKCKIEETGMNMSVNQSTALVLRITNQKRFFRETKGKHLKRQNQRKGR